VDGRIYHLDLGQQSASPLKQFLALFCRDDILLPEKLKMEMFCVLLSAAKMLFILIFFSHGAQMSTCSLKKSANLPEQENVEKGKNNQ
jgi:hypothetical protein